MKMKWMPLAAMLAAMITVPALAQEPKDKASKPARTVNLTLTYEKNQKITEKSEESTHLKVTAGGNVMQQRWATETGTKVTEVLEVTEEGAVSKFRVKWTDGTEVVEEENMGQAGEPMESDAEMKGTSILYTWNAKEEKYDSNLEKGDAELSETKQQLARKNPLKNPFVPGKEVKIGDTWDADQAGMEDLFTGDESITLKEVSGACTAREIVEEEGIEYLLVDVDVEMKAELQDDNLGTPELTATIEGVYYWNIKESRIDKLTRDNEGGFDAEVQGQQGKMAIKFEITGDETIEYAYSKADADDKGADDAEDDDEEEVEDGDDMD